MRRNLATDAATFASRDDPAKKRRLHIRPGLRTTRLGYRATRTTLQSSKHALQYDAQTTLVGAIVPSEIGGLAYSVVPSEDAGARQRVDV